MNLPLRWSKINISKGISKKVLSAAKASSGAHTLGELHELPFTESNPEWVLLYNHARTGQIHPRTMKYMKRKDLYFLAGHSFPHPAFTQPKSKNEEMLTTHLVVTRTEKKWDEVTKLQGNAARAKMELERRNFVWASASAVIAALAGGVLSGQLLSSIF